AHEMGVDGPARVTQAVAAAPIAGQARTGRRRRGRVSVTSRDLASSRSTSRRAILGLLASSCVAPCARVAGGAVQGGWMPLFNGRNLAGWDTFLGKPHPSTDVPGLARQPDGTYAEVVGPGRDPRGVFSVVDVDGAPAIRISGEIYG